MAPCAATPAACRWLRVLGVLCILHVAHGAAAQNETARARADRLFVEGKAALEAERYREACAKLAESQQLDPATGTLLALAICHEGEGRIATALREFKDVAAASEKARRADRATLARQRIAALAGRVPTLILQLPPNVTSPPLLIQLDGHLLSKNDIAAPLPIDPGPHVIEASQPYRRSVRIPGTVSERQQWTVSLPPLEDATPATPPPPVTPLPSAAPSSPVGPPTPAPEERESVEVSSTPRTMGWVSLGAGVAALGAGAYFGIAALGNRSDAEKLCPASPCSNDRGVDLNDTATTQAWVANVAIGLGVVGVAVGSYLLLRKPAPTEPRKASARIVPVVRAAGGGFALDGHF